MQNMTNKIDVVNQAIPFMYWKRFLLMPVVYQVGQSEYFTFPLDAGYGFIVTELLYKSDSVPSGMIKIEFVSISRSREYQLKPFYPRLISTPGDAAQQTIANPGGNVIYSPSPSPVDNGALSRNSTAAPIKNRIPLFILYHYQENVMLKCKIDSLIITGLAAPAYCDLVLSGYLIPEKSLKQWK